MMKWYIKGWIRVVYWLGYWSGRRQMKHYLRKRRIR